ncbi:MAG TPA: DNA-binding protein [Acidimicrobiales bacterium]|nr:DNA-binding protein [Acidimicrobiales bacterium]
MALRKMLHKLTTSVSDLDREDLREFCSHVPGTIPIGEAKARQEIRVTGEVTFVRIVPRPNGSPWLEATVNDGTGSLVVMWTGRRRVAGIRGGRRLIVSGRGSASGPGGRLLVYNPVYELLP